MTEIARAISRAFGGADLARDSNEAKWHSAALISVGDLTQSESEAVVF